MGTATYPDGPIAIELEWSDVIRCSRCGGGPRHPSSLFVLFVLFRLPSLNYPEGNYSVLVPDGANARSSAGDEAAKYTQAVAAGSRTAGRLPEVFGRWLQPLLGAMAGRARCQTGRPGPFSRPVRPTQETRVGSVLVRALPSACLNLACYWTEHARERETRTPGHDVVQRAGNRVMVWLDLIGSPIGQPVSPSSLEGSGQGGACHAAVADLLAKRATTTR